MHKCNYCGKNLNRNIFCNDSHRVMYHRKKGTQTNVQEKKPKVILTCVHGYPKDICQKCKK